jgi:Flp pilus assembly protein TadG
VELALISPVMVLLVFGILDLGRAYRLHIQLENGAREGAAFAQLYPNQASCASKRDVEDRVIAEEPALSGTPGFAIAVFGEDSAGNMVPISGCDGNVGASGRRARVDVSATYAITTPLVASVVGSSIDLTGSAEVRIQGIGR